MVKPSRFREIFSYADGKYRLQWVDDYSKAAEGMEISWNKGPRNVAWAVLTHYRRFSPGDDWFISGDEVPIQSNDVRIYWPRKAQDQNLAHSSYEYLRRRAKWMQKMHELQIRMRPRAEFLMGLGKKSSNAVTADLRPRFGHAAR